MVGRTRTACRAAVSAAPLVYVQTTADDPTINPVGQGILMRSERARGSTAADELVTYWCRTCQAYHVGHRA
jgi:hypothetical protein